MNEIADKLREITGARATYCMLARVTEVNETERSATVEPLNGDAALYRVRLQTLLSQGVGILIKPKINSQVIVSFLDKNVAYFSMYSEVEYTEIKIENHLLSYDKDGLHLQNGAVDLKAELDKLFDILTATFDVLNQFQVATNMGPSVAVMPHIITKINAEKSKLNQVKSNFSKLIK